MRSRWTACAAMIAVLSLAAAAATPTTTLIQDTLYKADGTLFEGFAEIQWKTFQTAGGAEVPQNLVTVRVTGGHLRATLVPTTNAARPSYYTVRYNADGRTQFVEYWSVPPTSAILKLSDVRTHGPVASPVTTPPPMVAIQDVSGLRTELDLRPARGASWMASRTAVIGASGAIEGAIGLAGDCVRVDGTSGPCGFGGMTFVDGETPNGTIDGVNTAFALSVAPSPAAGLALYRNGMLLKQGQEYTLTGSAITMAPGNAPLSGDSLQAYYRITMDATSTVNVVDLQAPVGTVDGVNRNFTLTEIPLPAASLQVFRNGLLQKVGVDYTLAVNVITFLPESVPQAGDILQATYRK